MDLIALGILPPDSPDNGHFDMPVNCNSSSDGSDATPTEPQVHASVAAIFGTATPIVSSPSSAASNTGGNGGVVNIHMLKSHAPTMPAHVLAQPTTTVRAANRI